jgi:hypothetical protein
MREKPLSFKKASDEEKNQEGFISELSKKYEPPKNLPGLAFQKIFLVWLINEKKMVWKPCRSLIHLFLNPVCNFI